MKAINVLLSIVVCVLLFLLAMEGGLRLMGKGPNEKINQADAALGWSKKPGFEFSRRTSEFDVVLSTNELGLRDDSMESAAKPEGTHRVVCLGDSFVLGYTVDRSDLFVDQLEGWWQAEGRKVDVINTGTEGYATDQEVAWLQEHGEEFSPDLVLLFVYENDLYWNGQATYLGTPKPRFDVSGKREDAAEPKSSWRDSTAVGRLFKGSPSPIFVTSPASAEGPILADFSVLLNSAPPELGDALDRSKGALKALKKSCEDLGSELVVVPIPSHSAISSEYRDNTFGPTFMGNLPNSEWSPDRPIEFVIAACNELGIKSLDPRAHLKAKAADAALYNQVDFHLTPKGNHALTAFLKTELDGLGVVPPATGTAVAQPDSATISGGREARWPYFFSILWVLLGTGYAWSYRKEENPVVGILKVGVLLSVIFAIVIGGGSLIETLPPALSSLILLAFVVGLVGFIVFKLGRRTSTILELFVAFVARGHWYLMPLVVVLMTIGSLLVVAASSPLVAPFIYTLF
ncbi:MAG: hypothetical protein ACI841_002409 [Planctomycetota bacterium]|jgi:hypothetical protein